ncbi:MAG TPA: hypothetical protein VF791_15715 [Pyrinomonadaceae bacterium]
MKRKNLIAFALILFCFSGAVVAQKGLGRLKSWAGKYPTDRKGKVTRKFFNLPEIRQPLSKLLKRGDYNLLTREYTVESPIKLIGDYLAIKVCRPHDCDTEQGAYAINLTTGFIYVRMKAGDEVRWFGSKGEYTDLPQEVQDYLTDFAAN